MGDEYDDVDHAGGLEVGIAATGVRHDCRRFRKIVYQLPPMPIPLGGDMRYWEDANRQTTGGCGFWNTDIAWVLGTFAPALKQAFIAGARLGSSAGQNVAVIDNTELFQGHKLCQNGATRTADGTGAPPPTNAPDTFTTTEWVRGISVIQAEEAFTDQTTVGMHPMFWGQRALAACAATASVQMPATPSFSQYTCSLSNPTTLVDGTPAVSVS